MSMMSSIRRDFVASHLRSHSDRLLSILNNIESEERIDCGYAYESLRAIEDGLRKIRNLCSEN